MATENPIKNPVENIRKNVDPKNEDGHISPVLAYRRQQESIKSKKSCEQSGIHNDRKREPWIRGKEFKISSKYHFHDEENESWNESQYEKEEKNNSRFAEQIVPFFQRTRKIELQGIVFQIIRYEACPAEDQYHDHHEKKKVIRKIGLEIGGIDI